MFLIRGPLEIDVLYTKLAMLEFCNVHKFKNVFDIGISQLNLISKHNDKPKFELKPIQHLAVQNIMLKLTTLCFTGNSHSLFTTHQEGENISSNSNRNKTAKYVSFTNLPENS